MKPAKVESTVTNGALAVKVREYADGRFGFDVKPSGQFRKKIRLTTPEAAEEKAQELLGSAQAGKVQRMEIDPQEYQEFLRWKAANKEPAMLEKLVPAFFAAKKRKNVTGHTVRSLASTLLPLAKAFPGPISELTPEWVESWIESKPRGPRRWNNMLSALTSIHRFARRNGLLPAELTPVECMERQKLRYKVQTYTVEQLRKLIEAAPEPWRPLIVLGAFAGVRPEELAPETRYGDTKPCLCWEHIKALNDKIDIPEEVAKDRRRRFAPLLPAAIGWLDLKSVTNRKGPIVPQQRYQKIRDKWCRDAGVKWLPDGLRHSFASYRLALFPDMPKLSLEMGNSIAMIRRHYLDLKHEEEAREWFALMPKSSKVTHEGGHGNALSVP